jgi:hypothetical protein
MIGNIILQLVIYVIYIMNFVNVGQFSWLRYYATDRKVTGSIADEVIGFFN